MVKLLQVNLQTGGGKVTAHLLVNNGALQLAVQIPEPPGDPDTWTLGQIKAAAITAARSQIPTD